MAKTYYVKALQAGNADILYEGKIAGQIITIERSNIQKALAALE